MPQLILSRARDTGGQIRRMRMLVDGKTRARLWRASEVTIDVPAGSHVVQAGMDWCRSRPVTVELAEGDTVETESSIEAADWFALLTRPRSALHLKVL